MAEVFLGLTYEIWALLTFAIMGIFYWIYKGSMAGIPNKMIVLRRNGQSGFYKAVSEIGGVFVKIVKGQKIIKTVTVKGQPIDVHLGGRRFERWFVMVEGQEETLDLYRMSDEQAKEGRGRTTTTHEALGATKGLLKLLNEALQGSFRTMILPMVSGIAIGVALTMVLERVFAVKGPA